MNTLSQLFFENIKLNICEFTYYDLTSESWNFSSIDSPYNRIYYIEKGYGFVTPLHENSQTLKLETGHFYLLPKNTKYKMFCPEYMTQFYIHFNLEFISSYDVFQELKKPIVLSSNPLDFDLRSIDLSNSIDLFKAYSLVSKLIYEFVDSNHIDITQQLLISKQYSSVFEYLNNNLSIQLSLDEMSSALSLSPSFLMKNFKKDIGSTVKQYNTQLILKKSKEILYTSSKTVKEVAFMFGFSDEFYFSRLFKQHFGVSPREYRKKTI